MKDKGNASRFRSEWGEIKPLMTCIRKGIFRADNLTIMMPNRWLPFKSENKYGYEDKNLCYGDWGNTFGLILHFSKVLRHLSSIFQIELK